MTDAIQMPQAKWRKELRITTNRGGDRVFMDQRQLREFSVATAEDLAMLTTVIEDSALDTSYVMQTLGLVNDLAFQLQQSVALICDSGESVTGHEPVKQEVHHE